MARSTFVVCSASSERWSSEDRFAGLKCSLPSAQSTAGETVAAFAVHILEADQTAASRAGSACAAASSIGTGQGRQDRLGDTQLGDQPHLVEPLQGCCPGIGWGIVMLGRGKIAIRQTRVVVSRPHQSIKVEFAHLLVAKERGPEMAAPKHFGRRPSPAPRVQDWPRRPPI
jgi:hypothetical protein